MAKNSVGVGNSQAVQGLGEARVVERPKPPGHARFVPIGSQEDEETEKTPRVPAKRPGGSKGSE